MLSTRNAKRRRQKNRGRDTDGARLTDTFQTRRDVHGVAEKIIAIDNHLARSDADAELHPVGHRLVGHAVE